MPKNYKKKYIKYKAKYLDLKKQMKDETNTESQSPDSQDSYELEQEGAFGFSKLDKLVYTQMDDHWKQLGGSNGKRKSIDMDKEVMKLVPEVNKDFINLYFAVRMGLHHFKAMDEDDEDATLTGREVAEAMIDIATKQVEGKLKKDDKLLKNIVKGINYGKKSGNDETVENLLDYAEALDKLHKKVKKKKGKDFTMKDFKRKIIKLILKLHEAENKIVSKYQK